LRDLAGNQDRNQITQRFQLVGTLGRRGPLRGAHSLFWIVALDAQAHDGAALQVVDDGMARLLVGQVLVGELGPGGRGALG
jgi:hypothetical protein